MFRVKRAYEAQSSHDGYRVLVDRLWPRGVTKEDAHVDEWLKEIGPTTETRKRFGHDPAKWDEFQAEYKAELADKPDLLSHLKDLEREHATVTLVYSAKDEEHNQAVVLQELLGERESVPGKR